MSLRRQSIPNGANSLNSNFVPYYTSELFGYFDDEIIEKNYLGKEMSFFLNMALSIEQNYKKKDLWLMWTIVFKVLEKVDAVYDTSKDERFLELDKSAEYLEKIVNTQNTKQNRACESKRDRVLANIISVFEVLNENIKVLNLDN